MRRHPTGWLAAAACALATAGASAQAPSDAHIQALIAEATANLASGDAAAQAPPSAMQSTDTRPVVSLTLDEAVKAALDHNLDISVQRLNPQLSDIQVASARAAYRPSLTSLLSSTSDTNASTSTISGASAGAAVTTTRNTFNGGISQNIPWFGGTVNVQLNNQRQTTTNLTALINPVFNSTWTGQYSQPLFRNFLIDASRQQLQIARINRGISDVQLRASITNTLSNVRNAYWDLVFATQAVEVARQSLDLATKLVSDNQTRVEIGTMAPIDVVQARAEQATRRQGLVAAESTRRTTELTLKRLIVGGTTDPLWNASIAPTDRPDFNPQPVDVEAAVRRALSERTDLEIARKNIQANDVTMKYLVNQTRPDADLVLSYGYSGTGGTRLDTIGNGVNRTVIGSTPGGYADALASLFRRNLPRWVVQMNISYPIGMSTQSAAAARARVQLNQVQAQIKQIELQVATDVTNAAVQVQNAAEAVQAAQASRELSEQRLEAEQSKFEVGMSTNYFVVQAQRDLADARNAELRATLNYRKALVELERLQQTTLQNLNITVLGR
ncbi:MAG: TolC family protein [Acidobacteria bacterium]|nr:TolC family protein [Acidobacteriota bacterium]